jgi:hypothetical protein
MDISDLFSDGDLSSSLKGLGLSDANLGDLGREVGAQLSDGDGFDLTDLLAGLDVDSFLSKIDVAKVAEQVGISPQLTSGALALIAPQVAKFMGDGAGSAMGVVGKLAGKLFD